MKAHSEVEKATTAFEIIFGSSLTKPLTHHRGKKKILTAEQCYNLMGQHTTLVPDNSSCCYDFAECQGENQRGVI